MTPLWLAALALLVVALGLLVPPLLRGPGRRDMGVPDALRRVYGVPETFVIDREGRIRYRHLGPVTAEVWRERLMPMVRSLR